MNTDKQPDFPSATKADWLAQVRRELKTERTADALRWKLSGVDSPGVDSPDGFLLDAYYTADDLAQLPLNAIQSVQKNQPGWLNTPQYAIDNPLAEQNEILRNALTTGADAFFLAVPRKWPVEQLSRLLHGIKLSEKPVFFRLANNAVPFVEALKTVAPYRLKGGLLLGNDVSATDLADVTQLTADSPQFLTVGIGSHDFHNAGATATQELAFLLARLTERYTALTQTGLAPGLFVPKTWLSVSVGTSYFVEIAKLRALRVLFQRLLTTNDAWLTTNNSVFIHAQTSTFYDAAATPYTNLLRATTEAMSATIGGCDALTVMPFDTVLTTSADPEFSQRMARNVSLLLADEGYMNKVADPSAGSYYVETLTHQLTEAAWPLFEQLQAMGGLTAAFGTGFVQTKLDRAYQERIEAVKNGRVLVGVTKYRHDEETIHKPKRSPKDLLGWLPERRLPTEFE
ncbi:MAG: methylmalonyl-CoA mutase [Spirosoma sp.]|nr:methylmalonyl-CoA mutase [Spirosoma sp.]